MKVPSGWTKKDETLILKLKLKDFSEALTILNSVAKIAERLNHHPDMTLQDYNELIITTTSHDTNGLTERDYKLAFEANKILNQRSLKSNLDNIS